MRFLQRVQSLIVVWTVIDHVTDGGRHPNEDLAGAAGPFAWIMDGAGTPAAPRFPEAGTDAAWLVGAAHDHLAGACHRHGTLSTCLADLESQLASRYGPPAADDPAEGPTSCLGLVHAARRVERRVRIEAAIVADIVVLVPTADGVEVWTDHRVKPFEACTFAAARGLARLDGALPAEAWAQIMANRGAVNRPAGYAAMSPARPWTHLAHRFSAEIDASLPIVMMSDGFFRLHDVFGIYAVDRLYRALADGQAKRLLAELREAERADPQAERHERFKIHDDATVLVVASS